MNSYKQFPPKAQAFSLAENIRGVFADYKRAYSNGHWLIVDIATRQLVELLKAAFDLRAKAPETASILTPVIDNIDGYLNGRMTLVDAMMDPPFSRRARQASPHSTGAPRRRGTRPKSAAVH